MQFPGGLLLAVTQNFRHNPPKHPAFFRRILVDARSVLNALNHQPVLLEFAFFRQNQVVAAINLAKMNFVRVLAKLRLEDARHNFALLVDCVRFVIYLLAGGGGYRGC